MLTNTSKLILFRTDSSPETRQSGFWNSNFAPGTSELSLWPTNLWHHNSFACCITAKHMADEVQQVPLCENQKYIMHCNAARGGPSHSNSKEPQKTWRFRHIVRKIFSWTDGHTQCSTVLYTPPRGKVINAKMQKTWTKRERSATVKVCIEMALNQPTNCKCIHIYISVHITNKSRLNALFPHHEHCSKTNSLTVVIFALKVLLFLPRNAMLARY